MTDTTSGTEKPPAQGLSINDLGMLLVAAIWGANITISRLTFAAIPPLAFIAIRFSLATLLLIGLTYAVERSLMIAPELRWRAVWLGLVGNTGYQLLFMVGLSMTTAANTALLVATAPIWVVLISTFGGSERLSAMTWLGVILSFVGVALVVATRGAALSAATLRGDLLVLGSALCWAIYTIGARPLLARVSALRATTWTMITGTPALFIIGIPAMAALSWRELPIGAWGGILYSALLSVVLAYWIWYGSIQRVGAARTGVYANLVPLFGVGFAWAFGAELIAPMQIIGAIAILGGVWLARRTPGRKHS